MLGVWRAGVRMNKGGGEEEEEVAVAGGKRRDQEELRKETVSTAWSCSHTQGELSMLPNHTYSEWKVFNRQSTKWDFAVWYGWDC